VGQLEPDADEGLLVEAVEAAQRLDGRELAEVASPGFSCSSSSRTTGFLNTSLGPLVSHGKGQ
jgi:hypothetical protein